MGFDLRFSGLLDFSATHVEVTAVSDAGRAFLADVFGAGAVSALCRKSGAAELFDHAAERGLRPEPA